MIFGVATASAADNSTDEIVQGTDIEQSDMDSQVLTTTENTAIESTSNDVNETLSATESEVLSATSDDILGATAGSFRELNNAITSASGTLTLTKDYTYSSSSDSAYVNGIIIDKTLVINGNGHTLNGNGVSRIFQITGSNVILNNITFIRGYAENGGSIYWNGTNGLINNSYFENNIATATSIGGGGAIYWNGTYGTIINSKFISNRVTGTSGSEGGDGGAIYWAADHALISSTLFNDNRCMDSGGAIFISSNVKYVDVQFSNFTNNNASLHKDSKRGGGAIAYWQNSDYGNIDNCIFRNNYGIYGGSIYTYGKSSKLTNSTTCSRTRI